MSSPIRLEFVIGGQRAKADATKLVKGITSSMSREFKQSSRDMLESLTRVEKQIKSLNRVGFVAFAQDASKGFARVADQVVKLGQQLDRMRSRLSAIRKDTAGLRDLGAMPGASLASATPATLRLWQQSRREADLARRAVDNLGESLGNANGLVTRIGNSFVRLAGTIYTLRSIGRAIDHFLIAPVRGAIKAIFDASEEFRKFKASVGGVVGGNARAGQLGYDLIRAARGLPMTGAEALRSGRGIAMSIPSMGSRLALGGSGDQDMAEFLRLVSKLALFDPQQGAEGVMHALREAYSGELRSLRLRLEIDPAQVAAAIGKKQTDIASDPNLLTQALRAYTDQLIPDAALDSFRNLPSVKIEKFRYEFRRAALLIGESGVVDQFLDRLGHLTSKLQRYFDSPHFRKMASAIGGSLDRVLTNIGAAILRFATSWAGYKAGDDPAEKVAEGMERVADALADLSDGLPDVADKVGLAIGKITDAVTQMIDKINARLDDPLGIKGAFEKVVIEPAGRAFVRGFYGADPGGMGRYRQHVQRVNPFGPTTRPGRLPVSWLENLSPTTRDAMRMVDLQRKDEAYLASLLSAAFRDVSTSSYALGGGYEVDALRKLMQSGAMSARTVPIDIFARVRGRIGEEQARLDTAAARMLDDVAGGRVTADRAAAYIAGLDADKAAMNKAFAVARQSAIDSLVRASSAFGLTLLESVEIAAPQTRLILLEKISAGTTTVGNRIREILSAEGIDLGRDFTSMDPAQQAALVTARLQTAPAAMREAARYGGLARPDANAAQLLRMARRPWTEQQTARQLMEHYRKQMPDAALALASARGAYGANPTDENLVTLGKAQSALLEIGASMKELGDLEPIRAAWIKFGEDAGAALENGLGDAIYNIITATGTLEDVMKSLGQSVVRSFSEMLSRQLLVNTIGSTFLGPMLGIPGTGGAKAAAKGAVWPSFTPIAAFADGGIVSRPVVGIIGEGANAEAVVPLPDNRSIPVDLRGSVTPEVNIVVVANHDEAIARGLHRHNAIIVDALSRDIRKGGRSRKALNRAPR